MSDLIGYFIMWAIAGAVLGSLFDNDTLLIGALKGLAIALFPIYIMLFFFSAILLYPIFYLVGRQKEYDILIKKISLF